VNNVYIFIEFNRAPKESMVKRIEAGLDSEKPCLEKGLTSGRIPVPLMR
jgi:hypothetical protein